MFNSIKTHVSLVLMLLCWAAITVAVDAENTGAEMWLSTKVRNWYWNPDGSCVQCSIGMVGINANDPNAASLLWDTKYGKAIRGGSWPARVASYFQERGIRGWNVTGAENTFPWMEWAVRTRRFAAIGAGTAHFQTLYGKRNGKWLICNNQTPGRIDEYDDVSFRRLHMQSGPWIVVLKNPSSESPQIVEWWL